MSWTRVCRACQLVVLAYSVYGIQGSYVMGLYGSRDHLWFQHILNVNWVALLVLAFLVSFPCVRNMGVHVCAWLPCVILMDNCLGSLVLGVDERIIYFAYHSLITKNTFHA